MAANLIFLPDEESTISLGFKFSSFLRARDIVKITGPLGAGKTTLVRGIVSGFGGNFREVHSPTFSLVHEYDCPTVSINHCDFYRLEDSSSLEEFGGLEFFDEEKLFLIEWPEKIRLFKFAIPNRLIDIRLEHNARGRNIHFPPQWKILD